MRSSDVIEEVPVVQGVAQQPERPAFALFLALAVVVLVVAVPVYEGSFRTVGMFLVAAVHHLCAVFFGTALLTRISPRMSSLPERWWLGWAVGLGAFGHLYLGLAHLGLFVAGSAAAVPALGVVGALLLRREGKGLRADIATSVVDPWAPVWLISITVIVALSLVPPTFHDAASYHISLPQQWMLWTRAVVTEAFPHSAMPMNAELSLSPTLLATGDPRAMSGASGLAALLLTGLGVTTGKRLFGRGGAVGVVLATMPLVCFLAVGTKSDLLHAVYAMGLLYAILLVVDEEATRDHAVLIGVFAGLCLATKTSGLVLLPAVLVALAAHPTSRRALGVRGLVLAAVIASIVTAPVFLQNAVLLNNPLFPMFSTVFEGPPGQATIAAILVAANTPAPLAEWWRLPWDLTFTLRAPTMNNLPGPLLLIFAPVACLLRPLPRGLTLLLLVAAATVPGWLLTQSLLRYNPFLWAVLALLAGHVVERLSRGSPARSATVGATILFAAVLSWNWTLRAHEVLLHRPSAFLAGNLDEQGFLKAAYPPFSVYQLVNETLPADAVILQMSDMRLLYLERRAILSSLYGPPPWLHALRQNQTAEQVLEALTALGATHLLFDRNEVGRILGAGWGPLTADERSRLSALLERLGPPLYDDGAFQLYTLSTTRASSHRSEQAPRPPVTVEDEEHLPRSAPVR